MPQDFDQRAGSITSNYRDAKTSPSIEFDGGVARLEINRSYEVRITLYFWSQQKGPDQHFFVRILDSEDTDNYIEISWSVPEEEYTRVFFKDYYGGELKTQGSKKHQIDSYKTFRRFTIDIKHTEKKTDGEKKDISISCLRNNDRDLPYIENEGLYSNTLTSITQRMWDIVEWEGDTGYQFLIDECIVIYAGFGEDGDDDIFDKYEVIKKFNITPFLIGGVVILAVVYYVKKPSSYSTKRKGKLT